MEIMTTPHITTQWLSNIITKPQAAPWIYVISWIDTPISGQLLVVKTQEYHGGNQGNGTQDQMLPPESPDPECSENQKEW